MSSQPVSTKEMQFAYYFLKKLGANLNNAYLITAVVAWLRAEVGYDLGKMYNKNNPLNIRKSQYATGYRQTATNGSFAIFSSLKYGAYAAADLLLGAGNDYRGYWRAVAAAKRGTKDDADAQTQARDFIMGIVLSKWDAGHYGLQPNQLTVATYSTDNGIFNIWLGINGKLPSIKVDVDQPKPDKKKSKPKPPPSLPPPSALPDYLDGDEARAFYNGSRPHSDLGNLPPV